MKLKEYFEKRTAARKIYDGGDQENGRAMMADLYLAAGTASANLEQWADSLELGNPEVNLTSIPWPREVPEYLGALESAGVTTVTVSDQSTGLMEFLEAIVLQGWAIDGMRYVNTHKFNDKPKPAIVLRKR